MPDREPWQDLLDELLASGDAHYASARDELVCPECGGPPHAHRPLCSVLRWPVHTFAADERRDRALAFWRYWTGGLRPLWIHHGASADAPDHEVGDGSSPCRCRPEIIEPDRKTGVG